MNKKVLIILVAALLFWPGASVWGAGSLVTKQTTVQNKTRTYLVYIPEACAQVSCPALFMFHGLGGTAQQAADNYGWKETADKNGFIVVFPESLTLAKKDIKIWSWTVYPNYDPAGKHWDIALITLPLTQRYKTQDTEFVGKMIGELVTNYKIDSKRVYTTGHSYGAFFSYYVAMCLPDKITAFASHSGGYVSYSGFSFPLPARNAKTNASYQMPGLVLHAAKDPTVSYQWSVNLVNELKAKGHTNQFITLPESLGHNWALDKNQVQWDFLKQYN